MNLLETLHEYGRKTLPFPSTGALNKMYKKNPDLDADLRMLLFNPRKSVTQPIGHIPTDTKGFWECVPEDYVPYLQVLVASRYSGKMSIRESKEALEREGFNVSSFGQVTNIWDRMEHLLKTKIKPTKPKVKHTPTAVVKDVLANGRKILAEKNAIRTAEKDIAKAKKRLATAAKYTEDPSEAIRMEPKKTKIAQALKDNEEAIKKENKKVLYEPTIKQADFHAAGEDIVLYGGAAGGGKSYAMLIDILRYCQHEDYRGLIIRRTSPMLKELIGVSRSLYPKAFPGSKYNKSENVWYFPSGATIQFGYLDRPEDLDNYQGLPYAYIGFDEIQHQRSDEGFTYLMSRLRSANPAIKCYIRASANPGGSPWVKETFIDPAEPNTTFYRGGLSYRFIPARLEDNPYLDTPVGDEKMSPYRKMLNALPEVKRKQLLEGDWMVGDDAMFAFSTMLHVTDELPPLHWSVINSLDYGYKDPACSLWGAVCPTTGQIVVYDELEMLETTHGPWALAVKGREGYIPQGVDRVIDNSVFNVTGHTGPGVREIIAKNGLTPRPADRNREAGWNQVYERLLLGEGNIPQLMIHSSCKILIEQLLTARKNDKKPDDIDDKRIKSKGRVHHWDMLDCLRYMLMARPSHLSIQDRSLRYKNNNNANRHLNYFM